MFKPLLRTTPLYSGNVKIACELRDYIKKDSNIFECNVRSAKLYPLSHQLFQKNIECKMLGSSYDFDLKNFYQYYSDYFYQNCFNVNKSDMEMIDKSTCQYQRNTDFEYGVKRISYQKTGYQYAFFAPIYIDDVKDIPNNFVIEVTMSFGQKMTRTKEIHVNIKDNATSRYNYLYKYLEKYMSKIDSDVAYISQDDDSVIYYGIDVSSGGVTKVKDNALQGMFKNQSTINNFDAALSSGFKRNNLAMKQILPLCFMFNIDDILTGSERSKYKNCDLKFSAYYIESRYNKKSDFYDFQFDYDEFYQDVKKMSSDTGILEKKSTGTNIQDVNFPGLNEKRLIRYQFSNKLTPMYSRWKLKYSDDNWPYVTNVNYAFSKNQGSAFKYREFPTDFRNLYGLCNVIKNHEQVDMFNFLFPLGDVGTSFYKKYFPYQSITDLPINILTYKKLLGIFKNNSSNSLMSRASAVYLDITSPLDVQELNCQTFYEKDMMMTENDMKGMEGTCLNDLEYFMNVIVNESAERNIWNIYDEVRKCMRDPEYANQPENKWIYLVKDSETQEIDLYESVYGHFNGDYQRYKGIGKFPKNYLFTKFVQMAYKEALSEKDINSKIQNLSTITKFENIRNEYSCDWFGILQDIESEKWWKNAEWRDVVDDKCYYRGVLYDMNSVYDILEEGKYEKIDKFGIFFYPKFHPVSEKTNSKILYADKVVARTNYSIDGDKNCQYYYDMIPEGVAGMASTHMFEREGTSKGLTSEIQTNVQFKRISYYDSSKERYNQYGGYWYYDYGDTSKFFNSYKAAFISLEDTNIQYADVNKYYDRIDVSYVITNKYNTSNVLSYIRKKYNDTTIDYWDVDLAQEILMDNIVGLDENNSISSFELLPIHVSSLLADKAIMQEIIDTGGDTPLTNQIGIAYNAHIDHDNDSNYMDSCYRILADNLYISDINDNRIHSAYNPGVLVEDTSKPGTFYKAYSYIWAGPIELAYQKYGVNFYRYGQFVRSSTVESIKDTEVSNTSIENYILNKAKFTTGNRYEYFDPDTGALIPISDQENDGRKINTIKKYINDVRDYIGQNLPNDLYDVDEYEYNPILKDSSGKQYAANVFVRRTPDTSRFYGDKIDESELPYDHDCLWIDTYNLEELFKGKWKDMKEVIPKMPEHVMLMLDSRYVGNGIENWRKEYWAKFLSKSHLYHYYTVLSKNAQDQYMDSWQTTWMDKIYIRLRRLVSNESIDAYNKEGANPSYEDRYETFKLSIKDQYLSIAEYLERYYPMMEWPTNFIKFYNENLIYWPDDDLYKIKGKDENGNEIVTAEKFEICFRKEFIRLNKDIYENLIHLESGASNENYRDLYIYRLETVDDYESKYGNILTVEYVNLEGPDNLHAHNYPGMFADIDQCLTPLFNDIFEQDKKNTQLYSNYLLNNITKTDVYGTQWGAQNADDMIENNSWGLKDAIYRYNKSNLSVVVEVVENDLYHLLTVPEENWKDYLVEKTDEKGNKKTWLITPFEKATGKNLLDVLLVKYQVCNIKFFDDSDSRYDQLHYIEMSKNGSKGKNEKVSLMTIKDGDINYGFYIVEVDFDNTINSFYLNTMRKIVNLSTGTVSYDYNSRITFFKYMNGYNIVDVDDPEYYPNYPGLVFRELLPFMKMNPLNMLSQISVAVSPRMYKIRNMYVQNIVKNVKNGPEEISLTFKPSQSSNSLLRYMNSVVPLLLPVTSTIPGQYNLKFKNVNAILIEDGCFNSIGDSVIYRAPMGINEYHKMQIYAENTTFNEGTNDVTDSVGYNPWYHVKSYNMNVEKFEPLEYKHYNCSKFINLLTHIEYRVPYKMVYDDLLAAETEEKTFEVFCKTLSSSIVAASGGISEEFKKYLYSKYRVEYNSVPAGLNFKQTEKVYELTYDFYLL